MDSLYVGAHVKVPCGEARDSRELRSCEGEIDRREDAAKGNDGARFEVEDPPGMERAKDLGGINGDIVGAGEMKMCLLATDF